MAGKLALAIAEAEAESRSQELAAEVYVRRRRALDEQIMPVWEKFRAAIKTKCDTEKTHLRFGIRINAEAVIERIDDRRHKTLRLRLLRESGLIAFDCKGATGNLVITLNSQNVAVLADQDCHEFASFEDAAEEVLSLLFTLPA